MFFTLEDPRAKVQGSRDPLGLQPIWSRFGREVVTNLTTVSRAVRGFAVTVLGRYLAERMVSEGRASEEDAIPIFLRFEQIAAYARYLRESSDEHDIVLGVNRVAKFYAEHQGRVPVRDDAEGYILSDQKSYGLWGLYSVSARASGLLADGPFGLTPYARDFVEAEYLPRLRAGWSKLIKLVCEDGVLDTKRKTNQPFSVVARTLTGPLSANERAFYGAAIRDVVRSQKPTHQQRQQQLASHLPAICEPKRYISREDVIRLSMQAAANNHDSLARNLERILRVEAILAPAESLFEFLQSRNGQTLDTIAKHLKDHWGSQVPNLDQPLAPVLSDLQHATSETQAQQLHRCDQALSHGDYVEAARAVLDWNSDVMSARGSAPWLQLNKGVLDVRYRSTGSELPTGEQMPQLWRNSYFIDTLKEITFQLEEQGDAK